MRSLRIVELERTGKRLEDVSETPEVSPRSSFV
jgi:hypothetical protein